MIVDVPRMNCPGCLGVCSGPHSIQAGRPPRAGDYFVCGHCGEVSIFAGPAGLRRPRSDELVRVMLSPAWPEMDRDRRMIRRSPAYRGGAGGPGGWNPPGPGTDDDDTKGATP